MNELTEIKIIKVKHFERDDKWHDERTWYTYQLVEVTSSLEDGYEVLEEADTLSDLFKKILNNNK